ncbi:MAG: hypothetical protein ACRER0_02815 [Gammaproteobacteria bacterium]
MHFQQWFSVMVVAVLISCVGFTSSAKADVEGRMPFAHIQYNSTGLDNSGPVNVEVFQNSNGIYELKVSAFGTLHTVTKAQLEAISGHMFNLVGISYSRGYPKTGGRSVYVLIYQGFSSGAEVAAIVTVTEHGGVRVRGIRPIAQSQCETTSIP